MLPEQLTARLQEMADGMALADLRRNAGVISERYRGQRVPGLRLLTQDQEALAYALVRMPATFGAVSAALDWSLACTGLTPETLLDVGAGTGAASWAADSLLPLTRITCLEREGAMRRIGSELMLSASGTLHDAQWHEADLTHGTPLGQADLVTSAYVLNELAPNDRATAVQRLWDAAGQMLLIVEPGTPAAWQMMMDIRAQLTGLGALQAAPCPGSLLCPIAADDWCCFTARIQRSRLHRLLKQGDAPFEDEKFTYLTFVRDDARPAPARVLRHPQVAKGRIGLTLCTPHGITERTVAKHEGEAFRLAKKSSAGDSFAPTETKD